MDSIPISELSKLSVRKESHRVLTERLGSSLSLAAETALLSINPVRCGFLGSKSRLRRSLAVASLSESATEDSSSGGLRVRLQGRKALKGALQELRSKGIIAEKKLFTPVAIEDTKLYGNRLRRLRECIDSNYFPEGQDRDLALLLAWSGVLAKLLNGRSERIRARTSLRLLIPEAHSASMQAAGLAPIAMIAATSGFTSADLGSSCDGLTDSFVGDFDASCGGGFDGGGFDGSGGFDSGGFDSGGGSDGGGGSN